MSNVMHLAEVRERVDLLDGIALLPGREPPINEETSGKVDFADEGLRLEFVSEGGCRHSGVGVRVLKRGRSSQFIAIKYSSDMLGRRPAILSVYVMGTRARQGRKGHPAEFFRPLTPLIAVLRPCSLNK